MQLALKLKTVLSTATMSALNGGSIALYSGTIPDDLTAITDQVHFGTATLATPSGAVDAGILALATPDDVQSLNNGEPTFVRFTDADGVVLFDAPAGAISSGLPVTISPLHVQAGGMMTLTITLGW